MSALRRPWLALLFLLVVLLYGLIQGFMASRPLYEEGVLW